MVISNWLRRKLWQQEQERRRVSEVTGVIDRAQGVGFSLISTVPTSRCNFFWPVLIFGKSTRKTGDNTRKQAKSSAFLWEKLVGANFYAFCNYAWSKSWPDQCSGVASAPGESDKTCGVVPTMGTDLHMSHLLLLGKFEYTGGPIFKVVLEC